MSAVRFVTKQVFQTVWVTSRRLEHIPLNLCNSPTWATNTPGECLSDLLVVILFPCWTPWSIRIKFIDQTMRLA